MPGDRRGNLPVFLTGPEPGDEGEVMGFSGRGTISEACFLFLPYVCFGALAIDRIVQIRAEALPPACRSVLFEIELKYILEARKLM